MGGRLKFSCKNEDLAHIGGLPIEKEVSTVFHWYCMDFVAVMLFTQQIFHLECSDSHLECSDISSD